MDKKPYHIRAAESPITATPSGGRREISDGRGAFELLPPHAILMLAKHFQAGAHKYGARNWEQGIALDRCIQSCLRHVFALMAGDTSENHAVAAAWNLLVYVDLLDRIQRGVLPWDLAAECPWIQPEMAQ